MISCFIYFYLRLHTYLESTKPIIDLYEAMGKVRKVDASKSVDEVSCKNKKFGIKLLNTLYVIASWVLYFSNTCFSCISSKIQLIFVLKLFYWYNNIFCFEIIDLRWHKLLKIQYVVQYFLRLIYMNKIIYS